MKTPKTSKMMAGLMALFGLAATCKAVDYHVNTPQTLQNALSFAAASSVSNNIYVTNGYYTGNFDYSSSNVNNLTILAEPGVSNTQITIDGAGLGSSMYISGSATVNITVQGMTFLGNCGTTSKGGLQIAGGNTAILVNDCRFLWPSNSSGMGLDISSGQSATIANCTAAGSQNWSSGIGISISGITSNVVVQNCTITTNLNGGLYVSGVGVVAVSNCLFIGNLPYTYFVEYSGTFGSGAGAYCSATTVILSGNTFIGNSEDAPGSGGGAYCYGTTVTVSGNNFTSNSANGTGAGIYCYGTTVLLASNTFSSNSAGSGGGAYCSGTTITLSGNTYTDNSANDGYPGGYGGGTYCSGTAITLSGNNFTGNSVSGGVGYGDSPAPNNGGGAYCSCGTTLTLSGNTFTSNSAAVGPFGGSTYGGGLYASGPTINLLDNLVVKNAVSSTSSQGGGIWVDASATLNMDNNSVSGNTSAGSGGGVAYVVTGTVELLNVYNNIIWGNLATGNGGDVYLAGTGQQKVFDFNDVDSMYGVWNFALSNIDVSPQFFNPISGDYHTQSTSPCIAAGTTNAPSLPATDLDGNLRILNGLVDMGCYEFTTNVTHPADTNGSFVITPTEFTAYAAAWKAGQTWTNGPNPGPNPVPANYMTRAGYLMTNGGVYYNDGSARPVNWKP